MTSQEPRLEKSAIDVAMRVLSSTYVVSLTSIHVVSSRPFIFGVYSSAVFWLNHLFPSLDVRDNSMPHRKGRRRVKVVLELANAWTFSYYYSLICVDGGDLWLMAAGAGGRERIEN